MVCFIICFKVWNTNTCIATVNKHFFFSAEKLFVEMAKLGQNALFPLVVVNNYYISIRYEFYDEERCMYNLLQNTNG